MRDRWSVVGSTSPAHETERVAGRIYLPTRVQRAGLLSDLLTRDRDTRFVCVYGDAGVGKSTFLAELCERLAERGERLSFIDAAQVPAQPEPMATAFAMLTSDEHVGDARPTVLCIDALEKWREHEPFLMSELLARLPEGTRVLMASRLRPSTTLAAQWKSAWRTVYLDPLTKAESQEFLRHAGLSESHIDGVASFAGGSPLLLSLASGHLRRSENVVFSRQQAIDVLDMAAPAFTPRDTEGLPRRLLATAVLARCITREMLLALFLEQGDELFAELRERSWVEEGPMGLVTQALPRRLFYLELERHHPMLLVTVERELRAFYQRMLREGIEDGRWIADILFLKNAQTSTDGYAAQTQPGWIEPATPRDASDIVEIIARHESPAAAERASRWLETHASWFSVVRDRSGTCGGVSCMIPLDEAWAGIDPDPALALIKPFARARDIAPSPRVLLVRHWLDRDSGQDSSGGTSLLITELLRALLATRGLEMSLTVVRDPEVWLSTAKPNGFTAELVGTWNDAGRTWAVLAYDWRRRSLADFFAWLAARDPAAATPPEQPAEPALREREGHAAVLSESWVERMAHRARLSAREQSVFRLMLLGRDAGSIATALQITQRTARFHMSNILRKFGVESHRDLFRLLW